MGCSYSSPCAGPAPVTRRRRHRSATPPRSLVRERVSTEVAELHHDRVRGLLSQSAFFQGLLPDDLDQLVQVIKPIEDPRRARRIPLARSEAFMLLGGMQICWDFVANQPGIITCRRDVAGEECLLRTPPDLPNEVEGSGRSTTLGEVLRAFQPHPEGPTNSVQGGSKPGSEPEFTEDDSSSRDDLEYLLCERLNLAFCDGDSTASGDGGSTGGVVQQEFESWYQLDSNDVLRLAIRSASFRNLLTTKLQPRARARGKKLGPLHCLTESEFRFLSQAFDYFSLSDVAKSYNEDGNPENLVFGTICDGKLRVTLEYDGDIVRSERRKSATLSAPPMPRRASTKPEMLTTITTCSAPPITASFDLSAGHIIGESEVFMEVATCKSRLEVLEEGVVLGIKASTWAMFVHSVASDRTQKRLMDCVETRTDLAKLREVFPCLRRCRDAPLRLLVDSVQTECCLPGERIQVEQSSMTYLVRLGTMMVFQEEPPNVVGSVQDNADVDDDEGVSEAAEMPKRPSSSLSSTSTSSMPASMARIKAQSVRLIKTGEGFNFDVPTVIKRASTEQLMGGTADRSSSLMFYTAAGSGRISLKGSDLSSGTGSSVNASVGSACFVWKLPLSVLRRLIDLDCVFSADFEFMTMSSAIGLAAGSWSSIGTTGSKLTSASSSSSGPVPATASKSSTLSQGSATSTTNVVLSPVSFQAVMNHPIALSHFRRFLISIHAQENLDFYWTVQFFPKTIAHIVDDYRTQWFDLSTPFPPMESSSSGLSPTSGRERIVAILKEFVVNGAPNQINIKSETHKRLMAALNDASVHDKQIFDAAMEEVFGILCSDSFPRFIAGKDDVFNQMIRDVIAGVSDNMFRSPNIQQQLKSPPSPIKLYRSASAGAALSGGGGAKAVSGNPTPGNGTPRFSGRKSLFSNNTGAGGETSKPFTLDFGAL